MNRRIASTRPRRLRLLALAAAACVSLGCAQVPPSSAEGSEPETAAPPIAKAEAGEHNAGPAAEESGAKAAGSSELELKTERAIIFKDGYGLIVKRGVATTDDRGEVYTDDVPDAAVLGSFWATPKEGRLLNLVAGWREVSREEIRAKTCTDVIEVLQANAGKRCRLQLSDNTCLSGVIHQVLVEETRAPLTDAHRAAFGDLAELLAAPGRPRSAASVPRGMYGSARPGSNGPEAAGLTVSGIRGTHFVLRTGDGDVLLSAAEVRRLTIDDMRTTLQRTLTAEKRTKRLVFRFAEPGRRREVLIAYFRPGLRWIPTYRIDLDDRAEEKTAKIAMQAELLNEAEDLVRAAVDVVVGVPNFRFRGLPSPLILEGALRNALAEAAPQLMGQFRNDLSNALFTQRVGEHRGPAPQPGEGRPAAAVELPPELTAGDAQELFVYHVDRLTLRRGERAIVPIFTAESPYRDVYTWDVVVKRNDVAASPSGSGVASPLVLSKNEVWRQVELTNTTGSPWTTGAVMLMQGGQPLAQELLTYTSPKGVCRVPITVAVDLRGDFSEEETDRELNALTWMRQHYAKIFQRATVGLRNYKSKAVDAVISLRFGGRAEKASADGKITLHPYRAEDWENYRGHPAVNNSSRVVWKKSLEAGETFEATVDYHFFTRQ